MFFEAQAFNSDVSHWNLAKIPAPKAEHMHSMFQKASNFRQILCGASWINNFTNDEIKKNMIFDETNGAKIGTAVCTTTTTTTTTTTAAPTTTTTTSTTAAPTTTSDCQGVINLDSSATSATVHMTGVKTELELTGLTYGYDECVDPSHVTFEVFEKADTGRCGTKSLASVVAVTGTPDRKTAHMGLRIDGDDINEASLGKAYRKSADSPRTVVVDVCVRASVKKNALSISFTEDILSIRYTATSTFNTVEATVDRVSADGVSVESEAIAETGAYQCDDQFEPVPASHSITQQQPILRVCIAGESGNIRCQEVVSATLRQPDNNIEDKTLVADGQVKDDFTEIRQRDNKCMVVSQLTSAYFYKATPDTSLRVTLSGTAHMEFVASRRRHLRDVRRAEGSADTDAAFAVSVEIDTQDSDVINSAVATGAHGIVAGAIVAMAMLM